jgi:hypothetical protein
VSTNHKRPLFAFFLVALACSMIIANGVRSQAVVSVVRAGAQRLVAGIELVVTDAPPEPPASDAQPELTPVGSVEVAAQQVFGGGQSVPPVRHRTTGGHRAKAHHAHAHARSLVKQHGHSTRSRGHAPGNGKAHHRAHGKKAGKGHHRAHAKRNGWGHTKGS